MKVKCQNRLHMIGAAMKKLAKDTSLPNLSRVTVHLSDTFFWSGSDFGIARYNWDQVTAGVIELLRSEKLKKFEFRFAGAGLFSSWAGVPERWFISLVAGKLAEVEETGCRDCVPNPDLLHLDQASFVWEADGKFDVLKLAFNLPQKLTFDVSDVRVCRKCGGDKPYWKRKGYSVPEEKKYAYDCKY